jgi:hypothetical protein
MALCLEKIGIYSTPGSGSVDIFLKKFLTVFYSFKNDAQLSMYIFERVVEYSFFDGTSVLGYILTAPTVSVYGLSFGSSIYSDSKMDFK